MPLLPFAGRDAPRRADIPGGQRRHGIKMGLRGWPAGISTYGYTKGGFGYFVFQLLHNALGDFRATPGARATMALSSAATACTRSAGDNTP